MQLIEAADEIDGQLGGQAGPPIRLHPSLDEVHHEERWPRTLPVGSSQRTAATGKPEPTDGLHELELVGLAVPNTPPCSTRTT